MPDPFNKSLGYHRPALTTTSIRGASLTCPSAVASLTHGSLRVAAEQSRACESRLACRHSTLSQIVNPMIQAGTRLLPASVSSLLYTLASANGEQMQGNRKPWQLHADKQPTASLLRASQWPAVLQKHVRNLEGGLLSLSFFFLTPHPTPLYTHAHTHILYMHTQRVDLRRFKDVSTFCESVSSRPNTARKESTNLLVVLDLKCCVTP